MRSAPRFCILVTVMAAACSSHRPTRPALPHAQHDGAAPADALAAALRKVLDGGRTRDDLRVEAECRTADGYRSAVVFGNGVGIWDDKRQFRLQQSDLDRLLRAFERHRFFALEEVYRGRPGDRDPRQPPPMAISLTCSVALSIGGESKRVAQVDRSAQSAELQRLADHIFGVCAGPGSSGFAAASMVDGLRQVATGALAPEVLAVGVQHRPEGPEREGWLLRLEGSRVTSQSFRPTEGYGEVRSLALAGEETAALAALLADAAVWELPDNISFTGYTDLRVTVLGQAKQIQARIFAGRTASPAEAARFEKIRDALERLHGRAQDEGPRGPRDEP